jgi:hypothetical protein
MSALNSPLAFAANADNDLSFSGPSGLSFAAAPAGSTD